MKTLVGMRFDSLEKLKEHIEKNTNKSVRAIIESESERDEAMDYMIDFEFEVANIHTIFYLKDNANRYYITEV